MTAIILAGSCLTWDGQHFQTQHHHHALATMDIQHKDEDSKGSFFIQKGEKPWQKSLIQKPWILK
ncbi:MAG TPA: hypothetical protein VJ964_04480 [Balneolaceae bacterium]|nr:hypothetical protein [Balneolaceae bacterium]